MKIKDAAVVITGGARGLGAALARGFSERGARVFVADIHENELTDIGIELDAPTMVCDVSDRAQVANIANAAAEEFGGIDLWINNAGVWMPYAPAEEIDFDAAHWLVEVNYFGLAYGMLEAARHMRERGAGVIANILSVRSLKGKALGAAYSASKFAAEGFTQAYRDELKDSGIAVVGYYPYRMKTGLFGEHKHDDYADSMDPADVAKIVLDNLALENPSEHVEIWKADDVRAA